MKTLREALTTVIEERSRLDNEVHQLRALLTRVPLFDAFIDP